MGYNPNLDLANINAYLKCGKTLSHSYQDIEQKRKSDINQGPLLCKKLRNYTNLDLVNINAHG